ncbi:MaoC family dehydratase [Mycoplasmatota bacterium]|nr:MaoC family dehydratase [Mycoplasmatota bacterium]
MIGKRISEINVGDFETFKKKITEKEVELFGEVSGDMNPAHFDSEYASKTIFKKRIAHGMLCASLFSTILGTKLPGYGTIYLSQEVRFLAPVYLGDELTAKVIVKEILEKNRVKMETITTNQDGVVVIEGNALVMPPK